MGSASTGQVLGEALGLALPGSALTPAPLAKLLRYARATGKQAVRLIQSNLTARRILTRDAFENAIIIYAAVGGSTNALLHLPVAAREATTRSGPTAASRCSRTQDMRLRPGLPRRNLAVADRLSHSPPSGQRPRTTVLRRDRTGGSRQGDRVRDACHRA
jgi:hypothetical protein